MLGKPQYNCNNNNILNPLIYIKSQILQHRRVHAHVGSTSPPLQHPGYYCNR